MPIRTLPLGQLNEQHLLDLIERGLREDQTLEFKEAFDTSESGKLDFLQDVTAMANSAGGTIVYGAAEGAEEKRGQVVAIPGLANAPEAERIDNWLRDCVDERIHGVTHRLVPLTNSRVALVVRIPASPLAPHMVKVRSHRDRFYLRGTATNDPMSARQIKESAMRGASAAELARERIAGRQRELTEEVKRRSRLDDAAHWTTRSGLLVSFEPLFPPVGGHDLTAIHPRIAQITPYYSTFGQTVWALEGHYSQNDDALGRTSWALFMREGGLEFGSVSILTPNRTNDKQAGFEIFAHEDVILSCAAQAEALTRDGLLALPIAVSIHLHGMRNVHFLDLSRHVYMDVRINQRYDDVTVGPSLITAWGAESEGVFRRLFDTIWQAWGRPRSVSYEANGKRRKQR